MWRLFQKTVYIIAIPLLLLSLLRSQQVSAIDELVDHDHQEEFKIVRFDNSDPVCWNVTADVWGYYQEGQPYYRTNHSVAFDQKGSHQADQDFTFIIENVTYYGLDLNGQIVYRDTIQQGQSHKEYNNNTSYEENVYSAFTYVNVTVYDPIGPKYYYVELTAWVSRRDDIAISNVTASPSEVYPSDNVSITVVINNEGAVTETFNVTVYRNDTAIGMQTVSNLAPGNGTILTFEWHTTGVTHGNYTIKAVASVVPGERDTDDNTSIDGTVKVLNKPPNTPSKPSGPQSGYSGISYTYYTSTIDLNGDNVWYQLDWDDGTDSTVGPFDSGATASANHTWNITSTSKTFNVTVRARDNYYAWSYWSEALAVTIQLSGGCPFVFVWNGTQYVIDNNLLPKSANNGGAEVEDYYRLEQSLVPLYQQKDHLFYSLLLSEFQQEHSYFDQVRLLAVDHDADVNVAASPNGEILTYKALIPPISATNSHGNDAKPLLQEIDNNYYEGSEGDYIILNFGVVNAENAKIVMRADAPPRKWSIHIQVLDSTGNWLDVASVIPRTYWATEIIDLSNYLSHSQDLMVRLYFTANHKVDYIGLDTTSQAQINIQQAQLLLAYHSVNGNITAKVLWDDDAYAELVPGQQIALLFSATSQSQKQRTFIIYIKGYYITITK